MAQPARDNRMSRRSWLLAGLAIPLFRARGAQVLSVVYDGDNLHPLAPPTLHFLAGKPLDRLKNAATVVFASQLTIFGEDRTQVLKQATERMIVSYDIWEEKFSVKLSVAAMKTKQPLPSAAATEAWCLENLAISTLGLAPARPFYLRWDLRAVSPRNMAGNVVGDPGISLTGFMIELFSRRPAADEAHWQLESGRLRLQDLTRKPGRGRIG
jgi:hypothetical protein